MKALLTKNSSKMDKKKKCKILFFFSRAKQLVLDGKHLLMYLHIFLEYAKILLVLIG